MSSEEDLKMVGDDYYKSLHELTLNSRPIINTLTVLAQENIAAAKYITNSIVKRINKCVPGHKLYALYLLDSICKNIGSPYTVLFAGSLAAVYIETYTIVDDISRKKMIDLFKTWKSAKSTSGMPLFPPEPINHIEKFLLKVARPPQQQRMNPLLIQQQRQFPPQNQYIQPPPPPQNDPQLLTKLLINEIGALQSIFTGKLATNPQDTTSNQKLTILGQLKMILSSQTLSLQDLAPIEKQLKDFSDTERQNSQKKQVLTYTPPPPPPQNFNNLPPQQVYNNNNIDNSNVAPKVYGNNNLNNNVNGNFSMLNGNQNQNQNQNGATKPNKSISMGALLNTLQSTGLIKLNNKSNTLLPSQKDAMNILNMGNIKPPNIEPKSDIPSNSILQNILSKTNQSKASNDISNFELTMESIILQSKNVEQFHHLLYDEKSIKCSNCGKRFKSEKESQDHLDWHFRINKRLRSTSSINARSYYLTFDNFIKFKENEILGDSGAIPDLENDRNLEINEEDNKSHYIVIPNDCVDMSTVCNICKDTLKGIWNDENGEWIWNNAIEINKKIYHWTCYHEANEQGKKRKAEEEVQSNDKKRNLVGFNLDLAMLNSLGALNNLPT